MGRLMQNGTGVGWLAAPVGRLGRRVSWRSALRAALVGISGLMLLHLLATIGLEEPQRPDPLRRWVLLDQERNIPTLYACIQLGVASAAAAAVALLRRDSVRQALPWLGLAVIIGMMALDEGLILHERLVDAIDLPLVPDWLVFDWVVVIAPIALLVGLLYLPWVLRRAAYLRNGLLLGGVLFVLGAVGLETLSGVIAFRISAETNAYLLTSAAEELLELLGAATVMVVLLRSWHDHAIELEQQPEGALSGISA